MSADNQIGGAARLSLNLFGAERPFVSARSEIGQQVGGFKGSCHMLNTRRQKSLESAKDVRRYGTGSVSEREPRSVGYRSRLPLAYAPRTVPLTQHSAYVWRRALREYWTNWDNGTGGARPNGQRRDLALA